MNRVKWYFCDNFACGHIRGIVPAAELNRRGRVMVDVKSDMLYCDHYGTDAMVFQRATRDTMLARMQNARQAGIAVIYDIDDDLLCIDPTPGFEKIAAYYSDPEVKARIVAMLEFADCVVCSVPELEASLREAARGIRSSCVIPNALDPTTGWWNEARVERLRRLAQPGALDACTIGWYGSHSHSGDAPIVGPVLAGLLAKHAHVRLHLIGSTGPEHLGVDLAPFADRVVHHGWVNISDLPWVVQGFDIGLAVLNGSKFNRSRSNVKFLEHAALEVPTVASVHPCYSSTITPGVDGLLAADAQAWWDHLERLVCDPAARLAIGKAARETLDRQWTIQTMARRWEAMYRATINDVASRG